jgi:DNA-binding LytR/AlgR family response regulator
MCIFLSFFVIIDHGGDKKGGYNLQISIAVCDSSTDNRNTLISMVGRFCFARNIIAQIDEFSNGDDFLTSISHTGYDVVFIEAFSNEIHGIDIVDFIKKNRMCDTQFIFSSDSNKYALDAFNLDAAHYLTCLTSEMADEAMRRCLARMNMTTCSGFLDVKATNGVVSVPADKVMYIEVNNKVCTIHTTRSNIRTYSSLDSINDKIDSCTFLRANRSFIVNMNYIEHFYSDHLILCDSTYVSLSRNSRTQLKERYGHFLNDLALKKSV